MYALCSVSLYACDLHVVLCSHARPRMRLYFVEQPARELEAEERRAVRERRPVRVEGERHGRNVSGPSVGMGSKTPRGDGGRRRGDGDGGGTRKRT